MDTPDVLPAPAELNDPDKEILAVDSASPAAEKPIPQDEFISDEWELYAHWLS